MVVIVVPDNSYIGKLPELKQGTCKGCIFKSNETDDQAYDGRLCTYCVLSTEDRYVCEGTIYGVIEN